MERTELEELLTYPDHKIVEVQYGRTNSKGFYKCNIEINYTETTMEETLINILAPTFVIIPAPGSLKEQYQVGIILRVLETTKEPIQGWIVQKIDFTNYENLIGQEKQIQELHKKLDVIWNQKDGTTKLDVLYNELLAHEQEEAAAINETITE